MKKIVFTLLLACVCFGVGADAKLTEFERSEIASKNILKNPGFESGKSSWTASAGTFAVTTSSPMIGALHATWDAAASADTLTSTAVTIPVGMYGRNGAVSCLITTASGTATHSIQAYDGSNILVSSSITSSTTPTRATANFIFPSSGSISLRLYANANEPSIAIDDCFLGPAEGFNLSSVSQAIFVGSAYFATTASCTWTRTSSTLGASSTVAACPGPTVEFNPGPGTIQTTDADLPKVTVNNLPPGNYEVIFTGYMDDSAGVDCLAVNDGTTTSGRVCGFADMTFTVVSNFVYTAAGNRTFELYMASASGTVTIPNATGNVRTEFRIKRFPASNDGALQLEAAAWKIDANISGANISLGTANQASYVAPNNGSLTLTQNTGSASVGISCSSTNDNTVGATTCSAGSEEAGIVVNLPRAGTVEVCEAFSHQVLRAAATDDLAVTFQIVNTANGSQTIAIEGKDRLQSEFTNMDAANQYSFPFKLCGTFVMTSAGKATFRLMYEQLVAGTPTTNQILGDAGTSNGQRDIHVTARYIDQQFPAPLLVNGVVNSSSGVTAVEAATINCDSSATITSQQGSWISSIGNISAGACVLTLGAGVFSSAPRCTLTQDSAVNPSTALSITSTSATSITTDCDVASTGTDCTTYDYQIICVGPK